MGMRKITDEPLFRIRGLFQTLNMNVSITSHANVIFFPKLALSFNFQRKPHRDPTKMGLGQKTTKFSVIGESDNPLKAKYWRAFFTPTDAMASYLIIFFPLADR